ncbi:hypothetical protein D3C75_635810 [compost metagenome]
MHVGHSGTAGVELRVGAHHHSQRVGGAQAHRLYDRHLPVAGLHWVAVGAHRDATAAEHGAGRQVGMREVAAQVHHQLGAVRCDQHQRDVVCRLRQLPAGRGQRAGTDTRHARPGARRHTQQRGVVVRLRVGQRGVRRHGGDRSPALGVVERHHHRAPCNAVNTAHRNRCLRRGHDHTTGAVQRRPGDPGARQVVRQQGGVLVRPDRLLPQHIGHALVGGTDLAGDRVADQRQPGLQLAVVLPAGAGRLVDAAEHMAVRHAVAGIHTGDTRQHRVAEQRRVVEGRRPRAASDRLGRELEVGELLLRRGQYLAGVGAQGEYPLADGHVLYAQPVFRAGRPYAVGAGRCVGDPVRRGHAGRIVGVDAAGVQRHPAVGLRTHRQAAKVPVVQ